MTVDRDALPYRPCVGVMLVNAEGQVFVGQRLDSTLEAWQMPQGGIDPGEDALAAAIRELGEETGIAPAHLQVVSRADGHFRYDLPDDLIGRVWKGRYRGQDQIWYLVRFTGTDADVDIATPHPEFRAWRWVDPDEVPRLIVPFKAALYRDVLAAFRDRLAAWGAG